MNELIYDLTQWCKEMNIKDFVQYSWLWERVVQRSISAKHLNNKENIELINEWLEKKIKELIRYKKKAEKLLLDKEIGE